MNNLLNVHQIIEPKVDNYNKQTIRFIGLLQQLLPDKIIALQSQLSNYQNSIEKLNLAKGSYYANIAIFSQHRRTDKVDYPWLVMIGSDLDFAFRKLGRKYVFSDTLKLDSLKKMKKDYETNYDQDLLSRVYTCFIISGCLKQIPIYITNNRANYHLVKKLGVIKNYIYNSKNEGTQIEYYFEKDMLVITDRHGKNVELPNFSFHVNCVSSSCCSEINSLVQEKYNSENINLKSLYYAIKQSSRNIDHLGNKIAVDAGELMNLIFINDLLPMFVNYIATNKLNYNTIKSVQKSILSGRGLFHVISKRTVFFSETINNASKYRFVKQNN